MLVALVGCDRASKPDEQSLRKAEAAPSARVPRVSPTPVRSLRAPAPWRLVSQKADSADVYRNADDSAQVTISQFSAKEPTTSDVRERDLRKFLELRQSTERQEMGASMTVSEPRFERTATWLTADYSGHDAEAHHRFATCVMMSSELAGVIFLEAADSLAESNFQKLAQDLFQSVAAQADTRDL